MIIHQTLSARRVFFHRASWPLYLSACFLIAFAGCSSGPPHYKIKGKVVDGDKPLLPDPNSSITIIFAQIADEGKGANSYTTQLSAEDGSFEIIGNELTGMPAGKYRVKFNSLSPSPSPTIKLLNQKFGTDRSPIELTIVDDKTPLVIDIAPFKRK